MPVDFETMSSSEGTHWFSAVSTKDPIVSALWYPIFLASCMLGPMYTLKNVCQIASLHFASFCRRFILAQNTSGVSCIFKTLHSTVAWTQMVDKPPSVEGFSDPFARSYSRNSFGPSGHGSLDHPVVAPKIPIVYPRSSPMSSQYP